MAWLGRAVRSSSHPRAAQPAAGATATARSCSDVPVGHAAPGPTTSGQVVVEGPVTIGLGRSGRYPVLDAAGHRIGLVFGDYVIGFTITCWDRKWTVPDLDDARLSIQLEAEARALHAGVGSA